MLPGQLEHLGAADRPTPRSAYAWPPSARIIGTAQSVSTLLTAVGSPKRPLSAGIGGLARTSPRRPSRLSSIEDSSPQM